MAIDLDSDEAECNFKGNEFYDHLSPISAEAIVSFAAFSIHISLILSLGISG
jgi:hypothetical protein